MFHEFGHALHGMFADTTYPTLSGTSVARDFVEFPSQFNEYWATYPTVFQHYAKHYKTGEPMPAELVEKIKKSLNLQPGLRIHRDSWPRHNSICSGTCCRPERSAAESGRVRESRRSRKPISRSATCRRAIAPATSRTSGAAAMRPATTPTCGRRCSTDDAFQWFEDHGGLTRANGDRFRKMVLSRGNTEDLEKMYDAWRGGPPSVTPMMRFRGLPTEGTK